MLSFLIPLRDIAFTTCYSIQIVKTGKLQNDCHSQFDWYYLFAVTLLLFRIVQCIKKAREDTEYKLKGYYFKAFIYFALLILTVADFWRDMPIFTALWYILFLFCLLSLFIWDVIVDWGLTHNEEKAHHLVLKRT